MHFKRLCTGFFILISFSLFAGSNSISGIKENNNHSIDSIQISINYLKKYVQNSDGWQSDNPEIIRTVNSLIHFAEDEHIDSVLVRLERFQKQEDFKYIYRLPRHVGDSLKVSGYQDFRTIREKMSQLDRAVWNGVDMNSIPLSEELKIRARNKKLPIEPGDEKTILQLSGIVLPDSLQNAYENPSLLKNAPVDFNRIKNRDLLRSQILEEARLQYNKKIQKLNPDSAIMAYRIHAILNYSDSLQNVLRDSLKRHNDQLLVHYNDSVVLSVNDSIHQFVQTLQRFAQNDSVSIWVFGLSGKPAQLSLRNNKRSVNRIYIKNEQNDSLGIKLMNLDKHNLRISIEDNVMFNRIVQKQRRDIVFERLSPDQKLTKIHKKFDIVTPWDYGGFGTLGFSQTYLNNWKAGGMSAFSFLMVLKGYANYSSDSKYKWENSIELRNGWVRQGGSIDQTQKNDDKLELISRFGVNAYKKWYYSAEVDFTTQFFNGYNYPNNSVPISAYLSPAITFFKLGLDYKPNKRFSLFLSPFTLKTVFVRDTAHIDQTRYGIAANSRSFWEPGLNADVKFRIEFNPRIAYETKYKMFVNYKEPFRKFDINWENTFVAQLTDRINMTFMLNLLYDDNVTFPTGKMDVNGIEIFEPKLQTRELTTIGFSYKINRHSYSRKMIE